MHRERSCWIVQGGFREKGNWLNELSATLQKVENALGSSRRTHDMHILPFIPSLLLFCGESSTPVALSGLHLSLQCTRRVEVRLVNGQDF